MKNRYAAQFAMADKHVWWIDERLPEAASGVNAKRLLHYGPYADQETAELKIAELRRTVRYRKVDLVASKQRNVDMTPKH
jgi:hypothetical protein